MFTARSSSTLVPLMGLTVITETPAPSKFLNLSDRDKEIAILEKYPLPDHWRAPKRPGILGKLHLLLFYTLCLCAYGRLEMHSAWAAIKLAEDGDDSIWLNMRKAASAQQNNILVLAAFLLATSSVFISTQPPRPDLLDYTRRGPYFCICAAFADLLGVIIVASAMILVTSNLSPTYAKDVLFGNKLHFHLTLIISAYLPICTGFAVLSLGIGIEIGAWSAQNFLFKLAAIGILLQLAFLGCLYLITSRPIRRSISEQSSTKTQLNEDNAQFC